ncbi:MAG: amidohydrolase family protein [Crocinitomix sp.]|nr:amidohydrolase family protein [Crocinitomix sp.]
MKNLITLLLALAVCGVSLAQRQTPLVQKHKRILLENGSAHIGNGQFILNSLIGIENGKILFVKNALTNEVNKAEWDTVISILGKHVYPGFIAANLTMGLTEIDAVRATNDFDEVGAINPNVRALIAYNTDSKIIYTVRSNGVLLTQSTPRGGLISGTSSIMALDGWNWEDAVYKADDGIHLNWPRKYTSSGWWAEPGNSNANEKYNATRDEIYAFFEQSLAYSQGNNSEIDLRLKAMEGIFKGDQRLFIHADFAPEINDIIDFSRRFNLKFPVIVGGSDAYLVADLLKENHFSVMLGRPHALPNFDESLTYDAYQNAYLLQKAGVPYCIQPAGDMEVMNARNLPFLAGTAWGYGLTEEEAVAAISLNVAKILGIDAQTGSLEAGKDATLFISDGNALDMRTNNVVCALIKGNFIDLGNHQKDLAKKYNEKYGLVE